MTSKLSSLCSYVKEKISTKTLSRQNYISTENMMPNKGGIVGANSLPSIPYTQQYAKGDVLFSNIRPYFKKIWIAENDGGCSNDVLVFRAVHGCDPTFLYYVLSSNAFFDYATATAKGTKMPRGDKAAIMQYEVPCFDYETQLRIGKLLKCFDDRIVTNQKINDNLQQQANLIFDELVGRLIPTMNDSNCNLQLHEIGSLDILVTDYVANGSFKSLADNVQYLSQETDNVLIRLTDYNNNFSSDMVYISDASYNFLSKSKLYGDEIIISNVGANVGTVFRCPRMEKRMSLAPNAIMLRSDKYEHYLYLYFISHYGQQQLQSIVTGSAQPKFNKTNFRSLEVILPDEATLSKITDMYTPMYEQMVSNLRENKALTEIRDFLLPKLMSGELDVSCVQI